MPRKASGMPHDYSKDANPYPSDSEPPSGGDKSLSHAGTDNAIAGPMQIPSKQPDKVQAPKTDMVYRPALQAQDLVRKTSLQTSNAGPQAQSTDSWNKY